MVDKIKILVAAHKAAPMPEMRNIYLPVQVGATLSEKKIDNFTPDDTGKNISVKNPYFNELTALYWARYNLNSDVIGLVHYRRFFHLIRRKT